MQAALKLSAILGIVFSAASSAPAQAASLVFTATKVLHVSDRHTPAARLLKAPIRIQSDQKVVLIPRIVPCVGYCTEQLQYTQLKLVQFQRNGSAVTVAKAHGKLMLDNGENTAVVEITGNTDQTARLTLTTTSHDGLYKSQATLEGEFTQSVF